MRVYVHKSGIMQDILRHIAKGYVWYIRGVVPAERVVSVAMKLAVKFQTEMSASRRAYRKAQGRANARLFLHPVRADAFEFVLLLTDGEHAGRITERFQSVADKRCRLVFNDRFEAIRMPAAGGTARWTWRLTDEAYDAYGAAVQIGVRKSDETEIRRMISLIYGMPGFRGLRRQMVGLLKLLHAEWKRAGKGESCPYVSTKPKGYLRLIDIKTIPLDDVVARIAAGRRAIPHHLVYDRSQQHGGQAVEAVYCPDSSSHPAAEARHADADSA
ncbi:hypothetical protein FFK22_038585 [Mycobacterium sp. KBS0706]|uniref:hypothetical protein n=1 Tax=Mycobacterium sp. KBS0706 TaxID=2578109 RepID=UPI00110F6ED1|nr:hypothetical protein [Mycobacterium sp. KBS0706]TSD83275.1 hypothetical protein FFK22_038585 [Mycobacterium sp. KBS0706]